MKLNLPVFDQLAGCKNVLIAGMGGGYDVFCGLPVYFELQQRGQNVHLANFSFTDVELLKDGLRLTDTLVGVTAGQNDPPFYFRELHLARWFKEKRGQAVPIWCFRKTGARPLLENYRVLVEHLSVGGILLIDGGVDSLMRGDEAQRGTLIEDAISLCAVNELCNVPTRLIGCVGFGAEDHITHAHVLENIAALTKEGSFLGACSLAPQMEAYQAYEEAVLYAQSQASQESSVINSSIVSAVRGEYGDYHLTEKTRGSRLWISPFMPIYWFFDLLVVARRNLFLPQLLHTDTFTQAWVAFADATRSIPRRTEEKIPLS